MTHEDKGKFAEKHEGQNIDSEAAEKLRNLSENNKISCAAAHRAAAALNVSPEEIGIQIDLLELKIIECQIGLFGYRDTGKMLDESIIVAPELNEKLNQKSTHGRISCFDCWNIATELKTKRLTVGSACQKLQISIKPCQLGTF